jgi:hypothetical protein
MSQITVSSLEELRWVLMEKPILKFNRASTNNVDFEEVVSHRLSPGILGASRLLLSINPDPKASYRIQVGSLLYIDDSPISAVFNIDLPHLDSKVYVGLNPGDLITVLHRSPTGQQITTEAFLEINEVYWDNSFLNKIVKRPVVCEARTALIKYLEGET